MPPKRKTRAAANSTKKRRTSKSSAAGDEPVEVQQHTESQSVDEGQQATTQPKQDLVAETVPTSQNGPESKAEAESATPNEQDQSSNSTLADRMQKLKELKRRRVSFSLYINGQLQKFLRAQPKKNTIRQLKSPKATAVIVTLNSNAAKKIQDWKLAMRESDSKLWNYKRNK